MPAVWWSVTWVIQVWAHSAQGVKTCLDDPRNSDNSSKAISSAPVISWEVSRQPFNNAQHKADLMYFYHSHLFVGPKEWAKFPHSSAADNAKDRRFQEWHTLQVTWVRSHLFPLFLVKGCWLLLYFFVDAKAGVWGEETTMWNQIFFSPHKKAPPIRMQKWVIFLIKSWLFTVGKAFLCLVTHDHESKGSLQIMPAQPAILRPEESVAPFLEHQPKINGRLVTCVLIWSFLG